jgi:predicted GNAT family N-acyltransferase
LSAGNKLRPSDIEVYPLTAIDKESIKTFKCEKEEFNDYLYSTAYEDDAKSVGKVFIFTTTEIKVIGFATLAMSQLSKHQHTELGRLTTHDHIPGVLIGELARHIDYQGRGLGILMRNWIINHALKISKEIGCRLIILQAVEDKIDLYKKWGFIPVSDFEESGRYKMFIDLSWDKL